MDTPTSIHPQVQALVSYLEHERLPSIVLDIDYNILAANTAYRRQFSVNDRSPVGGKCFRVSHQYGVPCDQAGEHCPMRAARETRATERVLHIHHTPRGPEHVDVELRPLLDENAQIIGYVERMARVDVASATPQEKDGLVGRSPTFNEAIAALQRAAPSEIPVLLQGESGTGKELFARALHKASPRARGPLVVVDCTGFTDSLFESELFGYEKGAFTGAMHRKIGLAETAHGGTLFLDEIGDVPLAMQVKLLRLIESGTFRRVGGVDTLRSDFRLVAATHRPLKAMVAAGQFREDLYYRISAFPLRLPALRERSEDLPLLIDTLLKRMSGTTPPRVDDEAMRLLMLYAYPGNVRELRNILERARLFADDGWIRARHLPDELRQCSGTTPITPKRRQVAADRERLAHALAVFKGTRAELAAHLGMSERTLYRRLRALGLE